MDKHMEKYLNNVILPEYESPEHQQELRRNLLNEMERRRKMASRKRTLRMVYILAALLCIAALAVAGVKYRKYRFVGKEDGVYEFASEDDHGVAVSVYTMTSTLITDEDGNIYEFSTESKPDPDFTIDVEQKKKDLEEIDVLRQQNKRELVGVIETQVEDQVGRTYRYKYVLADGRETTMSEGDPEERKELKDLEKLLSVDVKEVWKLRRERKGELLEPEEKEIKGKTFVFKRFKTTLSNGLEVIHSIGVPKERASELEFMPPMDKQHKTDGGLSKEQAREIDALRKQDKRELLKVIETEVEGEIDRTYIYNYVLADGKTIRVGEGGFDERIPEKVSSVSVKETQELRKTGKGELLEPVEKEVEGKIFTFERHRFKLKDGREVIQSVGTPKEK
jgi:hypothetical protein